MKLTLIGMAMASCMVGLSYELQNPALNPVKVKEAADTGTIELLKNSKADFAIVCDSSGEDAALPRRRSVTKAAELFKNVFNRCAGVNVPIIAPDKEAELAKYRYLLVVGPNRITEKLGINPAQLPPGGFVVRTFDRGVAVVGYDGSKMPAAYNHMDPGHYAINGTLNGAYDFVERFLGVRYYYPGYGTIYPAVTDLNITPCNYEDAPLIQNRYYWQFDRRANGFGWLPEMGKFNADEASLIDCWRLTEQSRFFSAHVPEPMGWLAAHPKQKDTIFYTTPGGYTYYNPNGNIGNFIDISNLKVADIYLKDIEKYYASNRARSVFGQWYPPNKDYVGFGNCDTMVNITNETTDKLNLHPPVVNPATGEMSDVTARFHIYLGDGIKKVLPDKRLAVFAYQNYTLPPVLPEYRKYPDNVDVSICIYELPCMAPNKEIMQHWKDVLKDWYNVLGSRPVSAMWAYGTINNYEFGEAVVPRYIGQYLREFGKYFGNLQIIYCTDLDYTRYYAEYITYRSMWNPEFNVDAALDEQWKLLYGAAAPYVKEFYDLMSERWATVVAQKGSRQSAYNGQVLSKMEELLQKAVQAVKPDSIEMKRLLIFMKPWPGAIAKARRSFMFIKPSYSVKKLAASEKVAVDGKGEEKLWNNAAAVPFLNLNGTGNIKNPVHGKLVYDDKALYGLFEFAGEPRIVPNMWDCSNIELFLAPPDNSEYFQFVFFGDGRVFFGQKTLKPMVTPFNSKWPMPNLKYAVQKTENGWRLEFIIPFPDIKKDVPAAYSTWNGNIIFNPMQADKEIQAYSLTNGNNHEVECFGSIKFMGKGDL